MSAKIPSKPNGDCKDFFQAISFAFQLGQMVANDTKILLPRRHKTDWPIAYESAIALKLAAQASPLPIAAQLIAAMPIDRSRWQIQIASSGLIRFQCSDRELAACLQRSIAAQQHCPSPKLYTLARSILSEPLFRVQYVHARCCTLLRSATRAGWFTLEPLPKIPWLTVAEVLRLQHPAEQQTIGLLLDSIDAIAAEVTGDQLWQRAIELSQSLNAFQSACRVWGDVKTNDLPLAQARLGLTWAGQQLLQVLLHSLGKDAPIAL